MSGMDQLAYILQDVIDGLNDGSLTEHQLIIDIDQLVFHVASQIGHQLDSVIKHVDCL